MQCNETSHTSWHPLIGVIHQVLINLSHSPFTTQMRDDLFVGRYGRAARRRLKAQFKFSVVLRSGERAGHMIHPRSLDSPEERWYGDRASCDIVYNSRKKLNMSQ